MTIIQTNMEIFNEARISKIVFNYKPSIKVVIAV